MRKRKFASEIYWPLGTVQNDAIFTISKRHEQTRNLTEFFNYLYWWLWKFQNYTSNSKLELSWSKRIRVHWIRKFLTIKRLIVFQVMLLKISLVFQKKITVNVFMVGPWKCPRLPNWVWLAHHLQTKLEIYIKFKLWVMAFSNDQLK